MHRGGLWQSLGRGLVEGSSTGFRSAVALACFTNSVAKTLESDGLVRR